MLVPSHLCVHTTLIVVDGSGRSTTAVCREFTDHVVVGTQQHQYVAALAAVFFLRGQTTARIYAEHSSPTTQCPHTAYVLIPLGT